MSSIYYSVPKSIDEILKYPDYPIIKERLVRVSNPTLVYVNQSQILEDFPWLKTVRSGKRYTENIEKIIQRWLCSVGGVISKPHLQENEVNLTITSYGGEITAYRPLRYGRASIVEAGYISSDDDKDTSRFGLVDVKGCGVAADQRPRLGKRSNGLMLLPDAILELINRTLIHKLFSVSRSAIECLPFYGIVDLGIQGYRPYFKNPLPCVTLVRQAHIRAPYNNELPYYGSVEERVKNDIELFLRSFGVTSAPASCAFCIWTENGSMRATLDGEDVTTIPEDMLEYFLEKLELRPPQVFRMSNVQICRECGLSPLRARLVDFGHYTIYDNFHGHHLITMVEDRPMNFGQFLHKEGGETWVQPSRECRVGRPLQGTGGMSELVEQYLGLTEEFSEASKQGLIPNPMCVAAHFAAEIMSGKLKGSNELFEAVNDVVKRSIPWAY